MPESIPEILFPVVFVAIVVVFWVIGGRQMVAAFTAQRKTVQHLAEIAAALQDIAAQLRRINPPDDPGKSA